MGSCMELKSKGGDIMFDMLKKPFTPALVFVVTTMYRGVCNGAPITWVTPVSYDPPSIMISVKKESDTARNIADSGRFVVQTVPASYYQEIHNMAAPYPRSISEPLDQGLELVKKDFLSIPSLAIAIDVLHCSTDTITVTGDHFQIFGDVHHHEHVVEYTNKLMYLYGTIYCNCYGKLFEAKPY